MQRDKIISYLAGLFDGEGSFSIQVLVKDYQGRQYVNINPRMTMSIKYGSEVLDLLQQTFGGQIYKYPKHGQNRWNLSKHSLILNATEELLPYLVIKKEIAERFIDAVKLMPISYTGNKKRGARVLDEQTTIKIAEIALSLNPITSQKTKESIEEKTIKIKQVYNK